MTGEDVADYFIGLAAQLHDECIVEDEDDLARLALLLPSLCDALRQADPVSAVAASALARAEQVMAEIAAG